MPGPERLSLSDHEKMGSMDEGFFESCFDWPRLRASCVALFLCKALRSLLAVAVLRNVFLGS